MHMDGAALFAAAQEMRTQLDNGRIERIAQPGKYELVLVVRAGGKNKRLLLSADPEAARAYICAEGKKGPEKPFPFLMLLRKHLLHGRIAGIETPNMDRVLALRISATNELGDRVEYSLVCEVMGKHSNIILVDTDGEIMDSVKRVTPSMSSLRTVLPGERYQSPPSQAKANVLEAQQADIAALFTGESMRVDKVLVEAFYGISPFTSRQVCRMAGVDEDARTPLGAAEARSMAEACSAFFGSLKDNSFEPHTILGDGGEPDGFFPTQPIGYASRPAGSINAALDEYYIQRGEALRLEQMRASIAASINDKLAKLRKRLAIQQENAVNAQDMEKTRIEGELILAHAYMIKRGMEEAQLYDHYADSNITVRLDASLTAAENAAKRFKRYNRLKASAEAAEQQKAEILPEIDYLETVLLSVEQSDDYNAMMQVRDELQKQKLINRPQQRAKNAPPRESQPIRFISSNGTEILAGRNNSQNDLITTRIARSTDTWLHAQGMPGSHVVIRSKNIAPETLMEAAQIAAYFSRGRRSSNVPIDYTLIKNVRKPSGAKPGYVTYVQQKTLFVTPEERLVKSLIDLAD